MQAQPGRVVLQAMSAITDRFTKHGNLRRLVCLAKGHQWRAFHHTFGTPDLYCLGEECDRCGRVDIHLPYFTPYEAMRIARYLEREQTAKLKAFSESIAANRRG